MRAGASDISKPGQALLWLSLLVLGASVVAWTYPRAFPLRPASWSLTRSEAIDVASERLLDLGAPPSDPRISVTLVSDPTLELRLSQLDDPSSLRSSRLARHLELWRVDIYPRGAFTADWSYRAEVSLDGRVVSLLSGPRAGVEGVSILRLDEASSRAREFLERQGFEVDQLGSPMPSHGVETPFADADQVVRFDHRARALGGAGLSAVQKTFRYGVDVGFQGDRILGFACWYESPGSSRPEPGLRSISNIEGARAVVLLVLLPWISWIFVRRYHRGWIGVGPAARLAVGVLVAGLGFLLLGDEPWPATDAVPWGLSAGSTIGSRTWLRSALPAVLYVLLLSWLAFAGCAVGGSWGREPGARGWLASRQRLAAFEALVRGHWANSSVASSSLRGVASGLALTAGGLGAVLVLRGMGGAPLLGLLFEHGWPASPLPGLALLFVASEGVLVYGSLGLMALASPLVGRAGLPLGGALVAVVSGALLWCPIPVVSFGWGLAIWLTVSVALFWLYWRYDLLTALLAALVSQVTLRALPLVEATDPGLQLQGWIALLGSALPIWPSLRFLAAGRPYRHRLDDRPSHVRALEEEARRRVDRENAREIRAAVLPRLPARSQGVALSYLHLPAPEIGGDFYDVMSLEKGRLAVALGEVAGKGAPTGLVLATIHSALRVQVRLRPEVEDVLAALNELAFRSAKPRRFCTLFYGILDRDQGSLRYACAGHVFPYRVSKRGEVAPLESRSYPLGVRPELSVDVRSLAVEVGDRLFLFTDGLVQIRRRGGSELFGFERLEESLRRHCRESATALRDGVVGDVLAFERGGEGVSDLVVRADDLTILVLEIVDQCMADEPQDRSE